MNRLYHRSLQVMLFLDVILFHLSLISEKVYAFLVNLTVKRRLFSKKQKHLLQHAMVFEDWMTFPQSVTSVGKPKL